MRVYRVSPILEYSPFYRLTYFSKLDFEVGNICQIDFNNRKILAVVVESLSMDDAKVEIRSGNFKTKKVEDKLDSNLENYINQKQYQKIQTFAEQFLIPVGEVLFAMFGEVGTIPPLTKGGLGGVLQEELTIFPDTLSKKIKGGVSGKQIFQTLENLRKGGKLKDLKEIVIKDFSLEKYWSYRSPHVSQIHLLFLYLEIFNLAAQIKISLETNFLGISEQVFVDDYRVRFDLALLESNNKAKKYIYKKTDKEKVLDKEILEKIKNKKSFVFVLASGFASRIYCKDCGENYKCENTNTKLGKCEGSYAVLNDEDGRYLFCKDCKFKKRLLDDQYLICKKCGGWGMFPYGEGAQKVYAELSENGFSKEDVVFVDESEKKMSDKKIIEKVRSFFVESNGAKILLGSKRVLKILQELQDEKLQTVVLSLGPLVKGKYFDSDEKFVQLLSEIENVSSEIYIGKNEGDEFVLDNFKNKEKFIESELEMRKNFNLPPFANVISFCFKYRDKRLIDKFLIDLKPTGEIKKGNNLIYYWVMGEEEVFKNKFLFESLGNFGELVVANFIYQNFISKR